MRVTSPLKLRACSLIGRRWTADLIYACWLKLIKSLKYFINAQSINRSLIHCCPPTGQYQSLFTRDMARSILPLMNIIVAAFVVFLGSNGDIVQAKKVSCSCTTNSNSNKVTTVAKSAECKAGISKNKCCAKAAKDWPSVGHCKYAASAPELGSGAGQPSSCNRPCNATAGSQCVDISGGAITDPMCTCNTIADCIQNPANEDQIICAQYDHQAPKTYKGNVCGFQCLNNDNACYP